MADPNITRDADDSRESKRLRLRLEEEGIDAGIGQCLRLLASGAWDVGRRRPDRPEHEPAGARRFTGESDGATVDRRDLGVVATAAVPTGPAGHVRCQTPDMAS